MKSKFNNEFILAGTVSSKELADQSKQKVSSSALETRSYNISAVQGKTYVGSHRTN